MKHILKATHTHKHIYVLYSESVFINKLAIYHLKASDE